MRIAVRGTNWIGDSVMSEPAARLLRESMPDAHITLVTRSWAEGIFRDSDVFDEIASFDRTSSKISDVRKQVSLMKAGGFDAALLFPNSFESALVMRLAGIPFRAGYATDGRRMLLSHAVAVPDWKETRHEAHYYLHIAASFIEKLTGSTPEVPEGPIPRIPVRAERRGVARGILSSTGVGSSKRLVALGVGSTNSRAKRWPAEHYAALADRAAAELDARVVLVGSPDEKDVAESVIKSARTETASLVGKTSLSEITAILAEVDMLVANDMGLAHIGAAVGTRTLTIFGPTKDATTRPLGERSETVRNAVECSPCMLRDCPIDHPCMRGLSPDTVFHKMTAMLNDGPGGAIR